MMFVVDTNILTYVADTDSPDHEKCRHLMEFWRSQSTPWHVTWGIVCEFLRVSSHPNVFSKPFSLAEAWSFIDATLASPSVVALVPTERHRTVASEVFDEIPDIGAGTLSSMHTLPSSLVWGRLRFGEDALKVAFDLNSGCDVFSFQVFRVVEKSDSFDAVHSGIVVGSILSKSVGDAEGAETSWALLEATTKASHSGHSGKSFAGLVDGVYKLL